MYTNGRKLFPIKVKKRRGTLGESKPFETPSRMANLTHSMCNVLSVSDPVTLTNLVVILINIMYQHPKPSGGETAHTGVSLCFIINIKSHPRLAIMIRVIRLCGTLSDLK